MSLTVTKLSFAYDADRVLKDVSFTAPEGALTVILGRNGCGKSTLLKVIAGINPMQGGSVQVGGQELETLSGSARAGLIGYLPQFHQTVFPFSVEDVVLTGRAAYVLSTPTARDREMSQLAMHTVGMEALARRAYTELSGGERQLVMIARVLAQAPKVILLDEPAAHLDLANQHRLLEILHQITAGGVTVVAVLHDPNMAFLNAGQVIFLKQGRVAMPPPGCQPWDEGFIRDIYGVATTALPFRNKAFIVPFRDEGGNHAVQL
jgi:iron complex transport system ATP-binding protein